MVLHAWLRMYYLHSSRLYQIFKAYIRCHIPLWILHWCPAVRCFLPKLNHFVPLKAFKVLSPESSLSPVLSFQPYGRFLESRGMVPVVFVPTIVPHAKGCSCWIDKLCKKFNIAYLVASTESRSCLRLVRIKWAIYVSYRVFYKVLWFAYHLDFVLIESVSNPEAVEVFIANDSNKEYNKKWTAQNLFLFRACLIS